MSFLSCTGYEFVTIYKTGFNQGEYNGNEYKVRIIGKTQRRIIVKLFDKSFFP